MLDYISCYWWILKRRRDVVWSQLPDGALGKVMFCHDLGIILECCYYWKRVPSGHRPSSSQKYSMTDFPASSLDPGLPGSALWLDDEFWHPQARSVVKTTISSFDYLLLVVVAQSCFNIKMMRSHRYCKLRALSHYTQFLCFSIKMTCDFFFCHLKYFTHFFFTYGSLCFCFSSLSYKKNFKDNIVGCQIKSFR